MTESQNIEYKTVWKDEYLKWICGFANAQGGTIFIGKDDDGNVVGVNNAKKLLEELPNKITTVLGIVADVNLHKSDNGDYIEIVVEPQLNPVSCKGEYHYRSGSTKQELKGAALLLFHPDPEKFVTNAYIKIGYFESDSDLRYQDEIHGNLFEQVDKTMDLLFTKYIKALISYDGIYRVETFEYPKEAIREALHNAIAHKDYTGATPIQISVYKDKIMIWNYGKLPENWTIDTLQKKHSSVPHNPDISNAFFRIGYIEAWGRGIRKMNEQCAEAGLPQPLYYYDSSGFWVVFRKDLFNEEELQAKGLNERQIKAVLYVKEKGKITNKVYQEINQCSKATASRDLTVLVQGSFLSPYGLGAGTFYELNNASKTPQSAQKWLKDGSNGAWKDK